MTSAMKQERLLKANYSLMESNRRNKKFLKVKNSFFCSAEKRVFSFLRGP
jgi:hypothetical protein